MGLGSGAFGLSQGQTADLSKRLGFLEQSVGSLLEGFSQGNDRGEGTEGSSGIFLCKLYLSQWNAKPCLLSNGFEALANMQGTILRWGYLIESMAYSKHIKV